MFVKFSLMGKIHRLIDFCPVITTHGVLDIKSGYILFSVFFVLPVFYPFLF